MTGILFIAAPDGVLDVISDVGEWSATSRAPETTEQLWLALGFAYMVVITGICLVVQADVVRYRPLLLVLAAGKTAPLAGLGFFVFDQDVFIYLLNFIVDGFVGGALLLWSLSAGSRRSPRPPEGAARG